MDNSGIKLTLSSDLLVVNETSGLESAVKDSVTITFEGMQEVGSSVFREERISTYSFSNYSVAFGEPKGPKASNKKLADALEANAELTTRVSELEELITVANTAAAKEKVEATTANTELTAANAELTTTVSELREEIQRLTADIETLTAASTSNAPADANSDDGSSEAPSDPEKSTKEAGQSKPKTK